MKSAPPPVRLGITLGDPAGIGPEVALKSLLGHGRGSGQPISGRAEAVLIGPDWVCRDVIRRFGFRLRLDKLHRKRRAPDAKACPSPVGRSELSSVPAPAFPSTPYPGSDEAGPDPLAGACGGHDVPAFRVRVPKGCEAPFDIPYGEEDALCGAVALRAIEEAVAMVRAGEIDAIVTAPISKAAIRAAGSHFPGHTEMLQSLSGSPRVGMMLVGGGLRVSLVTIHEAYASVPSLLTVERVAGMIELTHDFLRQAGIEKPRLALAGLNPHAGEGGMFGDEESRILLPAVLAAEQKGIQVAGPYPADTVFHLAREGQFDAVVALYHDQALIPVKTLDFHGGVNVTMGLPFVRTSPDHGTAYGIAGQGIARACSMRNAVALAIDLARKRLAAG